MIKNFFMISVVGIAMYFIVSVTSSFFGVNITKSVPFRFYYHQAINHQPIINGDYIMFNLPQNEMFDDDKLVIKQVVCRENEYLKIDMNKVYCNDKLISDKELIITDKTSALFNYNGLIPIHKFFVLGSNNSYDSRYWGLLHKKDIKRLVHPISFTKSAQANDSNGFYEDKNRGWYKYEVIAVDEDIDNQTDNISKEFKLVKPIVPWERIDTMHPKEFSQVLEKVESYAMSYRSLETFEDYARLRSVALNRSMEFANVGALWSQLNPQDSNESWYPMSGYGRASYQVATSDIKTEYLRENKDKFGLLYFYRNDCPYCVRQTPIIEFYENKNGWDVIYINADESPDALIKFKVETVPTMVLVDRASEKWLPLTVGLHTMDEIEDRVYRTIKYIKGDTNEKDFNNAITPNLSVKRTGG